MVAIESLPEYSAEDIATHNSEKSLWYATVSSLKMSYRSTLLPYPSHRCIMDGVVYDLTKFAAEHPGGEQVLLEQAGQVR